MPQNAFFLRTRDLLVIQKTMQRNFFSTLHPLSTVHFATATVLAFVQLRDSRFEFHCYTQREGTPTQKSARRFQFSSSCTGAMELGVGVGGLGRRSRRENGPDQKQTVLTRFQLCVLVSGRTSARFRFGSPFLSKRLWSVDTVL